MNILITIASDMKLPRTKSFFTLQEFTSLSARSQCLCQRGWRLSWLWVSRVMVDTAQEPRLSGLFSNRVIARYPAFEEFYGMEDAIEQVFYLKHAAQGLEEKKQILYLWPVDDKSFACCNN